MGDDQARHRAKALNEARSLARSGLHADHRSIVETLRGNDILHDACRWFEDARFKAQLNQICAHAKEMHALRAQAERTRRRNWRAPTPGAEQPST
ncbi:hypothetical protein [Methylobacterium planeticum]|uniref:Uncharacterized protein n=1 Tax=Methylobacterium planeticum TaxID=2615211 RepID=A0A6N6MSR7_9HYPH|nr:hypothetical protein [Methylobacterium planeticum]KAB1073433.1 hypothetical protein F6X51_11870 [Methylobacterium planeticum]